MLAMRLVKAVEIDGPWSAEDIRSLEYFALKWLQSVPDMSEVAHSLETFIYRNSQFVRFPIGYTPPAFFRQPASGAITGGTEFVGLTYPSLHATFADVPWNCKARRKPFSAYDARMRPKLHLVRDMCTTSLIYLALRSEIQTQMRYLKRVCEQLSVRESSMDTRIFRLLLKSCAIRFRASHKRRSVGTTTQSQCGSCDFSGTICRSRSWTFASVDPPNLNQMPIPPELSRPPGPHPFRWNSPDPAAAVAAHATRQKARRKLPTLRYIAEEEPTTAAPVPSWSLPSLVVCRVDLTGLSAVTAPEVQLAYVLTSPSFVGGVFSLGSRLLADTAHGLVYCEGYDSPLAANILSANDAADVQTWLCQCGFPADGSSPVHSPVGREETSVVLRTLLAHLQADRRVVTHAGTEIVRVFVEDCGEGFEALAASAIDFMTAQLCIASPPASPSHRIPILERHLIELVFEVAPGVTKPSSAPTGRNRAVHSDIVTKDCQAMPVKIHSSPWAPYPLIEADMPRPRGVDVNDVIASIDVQPPPQRERPSTVEEPMQTLSFPICGDILSPDAVKTVRALQQMQSLPRWRTVALGLRVFLRSQNTCSKDGRGLMMSLCRVSLTLASCDRVAHVVQASPVVSEAYCQAAACLEQLSTFVEAAAPSTSVAAVAVLLRGAEMWRARAYNALLLAVRDMPELPALGAQLSRVMTELAKAQMNSPTNAKVDIYSSSVVGPVMAQALAARGMSFQEFSTLWQFVCHHLGVRFTVPAHFQTRGPLPFLLEMLLPTGIDGVYRQSGLRRADMVDLNLQKELSTLDPNQVVNCSCIFTSRRCPYCTVTASINIRLELNLSITKEMGVLGRSYSWRRSNVPLCLTEELQRFALSTTCSLLADDLAAVCASSQDTAVRLIHWLRGTGPRLMRRSPDNTIRIQKCTARRRWEALSEEEKHELATDTAKLQSRCSYQAKHCMHPGDDPLDVCELSTPSWNEMLVAAHRFRADEAAIVVLVAQVIARLRDVLHSRGLVEEARRLAWLVGHLSCALGFRLHTQFDSFHQSNFFDTVGLDDYKPSEFNRAYTQWVPPDPSLLDTLRGLPQAATVERVWGPVCWRWVKLLGLPGTALWVRFIEVPEVPSRHFVRLARTFTLSGLRTLSVSAGVMSATVLKPELALIMTHWRMVGRPLPHEPCYATACIRSWTTSLLAFHDVAIMQAQRLVTALQCPVQQLSVLIASELLILPRIPRLHVVAFPKRGNCTCPEDLAAGSMPLRSTITSVLDRLEHFNGWIDAAAAPKPLLCACTIPTLPFPAALWCHKWLHAKGPMVLRIIKNSIRSGEPLSLSV